MSAMTGSRGHTLPVFSELRAALDTYRPATVLSRLEGEIPSELEVYRAEALLDLDRLHEALACLENIYSHLKGETLAEAERLRAVMYLRAGWVDEAVLGALRSASLTKDVDSKAAALGWCAVGLANKGCLNMAETYLREAIEMAPNASRLLQAQARMYLEVDRRLEARDIYERMRTLPQVWAQVHGTWGCSQLAYLFGEFDEANRLAEEVLHASEEIISPLFVQGRVALACDDHAKLTVMVTRLKERSPNAESLGDWQAELDRMLSRSRGSGRQKRLPAFPTLVQRKDFCGPAVVELVMRYWQGGAIYSNDYIAKQIMFPRVGTPIYRMKEFFNLVGFETVRAWTPVEKLTALIEAGFPTIIQEEFSNTAHVAVVIGYDEEGQRIELQDPMTHSVTHAAEQELNRRRWIYHDGALIAYPRGHGYEKKLQAMGIFDNLALVWCDQAILALDQNRLQDAIEQAEKALRKMPGLPLAWVLICHGKLEYWRQSSLLEKTSKNKLSSRLSQTAQGLTEDRRISFYASLSEARKLYEGEGFIFQFEGNGALLDHDLPRALIAFRRAVEKDPQNARNYASLAEVYFNMREFKKAYESASMALEHDPGLTAANIWAARTLAVLDDEYAVHYARMAVDLSPNSWMAHLALAEALFQKNKFQDARQEVEVAFALSPGQPEVTLLRGLLFERMGEPMRASEELQSLLDEADTLEPVYQYQVYQATAWLAFESGLFTETLEYLGYLLRVFGGDPWGLQLQAAARFEKCLRRNEVPSEQALVELRGAYKIAIEANRGDLRVIRDYLHYLEAFAGLKACLVEMKRLRHEFPENGNLWFWTGDLYKRSGNREAAARAMIKALGKPDGIRDRDELFEATRLILETQGLDKTEAVLFGKGIPDGGSPVVERQRALGLVLASSKDHDTVRARELLLFALSANPNDALVILRLGDISPGEEDRELCYRRALELSPDWASARANLANYLVGQGREKEAWEFTAGHAHENLDMMSVHGRVLLGLGHFEEAASILEQAIQDHEVENPLLYQDLWLALLRGGNYQAALKIARKGLKLFGGEWYVRVAESFRLAGKLDEAEAVLERGMRKGLNQMDLLRAEYEIARMRKDDQTARHILEEFIAAVAEPSDDGKLGWAQGEYLHLLVKRGELDEARHFLEKRNLNAEGWGEAARAIALSETSELTLELAERTLAIDPEQYQGLFARAEALSRLGREEEAWKALELLRTVYPEDHYAYEKIAIWLAAEGKLEKAFEFADRSVELGVFCPYAWATRGLIHFLNRRAVEALGDLQTGWNRADPQRRERLVFYWWLLAELQGEDELAFQRKSQAIAEARTVLEGGILRVIEVELANQLTPQDFSY
jgi:tetratricopeptide (TPR) repeat protein